MAAITIDSHKTYRFRRGRAEDDIGVQLTINQVCISRAALQFAGPKHAHFLEFFARVGLFTFMNGRHNWKRQNRWCSLLGFHPRPFKLIPMLPSDQLG